MRSSGFGKLRYWLSVALAAATLAACGGGGGTPAGPTLGGTAAVGAPIVGGTVKVTCAGGSALQTLTSSAGTWSVSMSGRTLPCAVQVSGGTIGGVANGDFYHSIALALGTVNITPLTDLVVARLLGSAPQTWFSSPSFTGVGADALQTALDAVKTALGLGSTLGNNNPLTTSFQAVNGNVLDDILEAYRAALAALTAAHADLLAAAMAADFSSYTGFAAAFQTAYAGLGGGGGGSCTTGTAMDYALAASGGPYTDGQTVCFTASSTSLAFGSTTLTNPVQNMSVQAPYAAYTFTDGGLSYEVVFNGGALYEINLLSGSSFLGQFSESTGGSGGSGGTSGTLTVNVTVSGIAASSIDVGSVPMPSSEAEFCDSLSTDSTFSSIGTSGGGTLTINSCSFSGNTGTIDATLSITSPIAMTVPYTVTYVYN